MSRASPAERSSSLFFWYRFSFREKKMCKAQMFIVTLIFLAQFVFVVQQALIAYARVDLPSAAAGREGELLAAAVRSVNESVLSAADCGEAQERFTAVEDYYRGRQIGVFAVSVSGVWDCARWGAVSGAAPLTATVRVTGAGRESSLAAGFYRD